MPASEIREANYDLSLGRWHDLKLDWPTFLDDFQRHWPTDEDIYVDFVRDGTVGNGAARMGNPRWRRLTEERAGSAKSVYHFDVQGSVAKSTHAGIPGCASFASGAASRPISGRSTAGTFQPGAQPWWRSIRRYGAVNSREERNGDRHDAYSAAAWMRRADLDGSLAAFLNPSLATPEHAVAQVEGWILGVA